MPFRASDWLLLSPELFLSLAGMATLCWAVFAGKKREKAIAFAALVAVVVTAALVLLVATRPERAAGPVLSGMFIVDNFAIFFKLLVLLSAALAVLASMQFVASANYPGGEYYSLILFSTLGTMFMVSGDSLASIYVSLELMALATYVLCGYFKGEPKSTEAATKYFILGALSSAVLLYGISILYGTTAAFALPQLAEAFSSQTGSRLLTIGIFMVLAGLLFKIAAVPFHVWVPDVYEGAPTPITAFMSVGPKAAAYAVFARVFYVALPRFFADWSFAVAIAAAATLIVGNVAALLQTNVKRLLAYSSISNAGYALLGVLALRTDMGVWSILIYLLAYTLMNFGAFGLVIFLESRGYAAEKVDDWRGLASRNPLAAAVMLIFLLSLTGIPLTAGFIGKYYLFAAAMKAGFQWLAILAVLASAVSAFYYFRIVMAMYLEKGDGAPMKAAPALSVAVAVCAVGTLVVGIVPQPFVALLKHCIL
jgi:NADH-quinone oxidoreductase subunit N